MNKLQKADEEYYLTCGYLLKLASKYGIKSWNQKLESKAGELIESSEPAKKTRDFEVDTFELYP